MKRRFGAGSTPADKGIRAAKADAAQRRKATEQCRKSAKSRKPSAFTACVRRKMKRING